MSIFNDKALKGVADAVSKIMDEELKGNQHKIDANKNGKVDAHDFKLLRAKNGMKEGTEKMAKKDHDQDGKIESGKAEFLGSRIRAAKMAGKMKEAVNPAQQAAIAISMKKKGMTPKNEEAELDEAFPTVADAKKRMDAGKTSSGTVTKTKTGLVHKRDHDKDDAASDTQKKSIKYGARQSFERSSRVNEKPGKYKKVEKRPDDRSKIDTKSYKVTDRAAKALDSMRGSLKEERLSFTEMLHLYNESGVEVISKIVPQTVKFGDTEVELIDANIVNGAVGITVAEEVDNETFTKEVEAQKEKNAGRGKKAEVAKASVQAVEVQKEEAEQIDELSKGTLGSYIKAASHDVATKGALTRHFADKSRREKEEKKGWEADKSMKKADKTFAAGWKRRQNMAKAVDRLTKEDVEQIDERTLTSGETAKKEDYVKGMKKSVSGFKDRYGDKAKSVMYATATSMAKKD